MANLGELRLVSLGCILICAFWLHAQSTQLKSRDGALAGTVTDSYENVPIAGASIRVRSKTRYWQTNASTDHSGRFMLSLSPGEYELSVVASGFKPERSAVSIVSGKTTRHDSKLRADDEHLEQHDSR
jgi:Carboxypeptidase regulatory-like domain